MSLRSGLFSIVDPLTRSQKQALLLGVDLLIAPAALIMTCALVHNSFVPTSLVRLILPLLPVVMVMAGVLSFVTGIYRVQLKAFETVAIMKAGLMALLMAVGLGAAVHGFDLPFPGAGIILFGMLFFLLSVGLRMGLLHTLLWVLRWGKPRHRVLIYGAGNTGVQLAAALRSHDTIVPVAFIDDKPSLHGTTISGLRVLPPDQIPRLVRDRDIARVLLAMPSASPPRQAQIARGLQETGMKVMHVPSFAQLVGEEKLIDALAPVVPGRFLNRRQVEAVLPQGAEAYVGRSVLVSGAGGSVGSELCRQLLAARPRRIVLFEVSEIALYNIDRELRELPGHEVEVVPVLGSVTDARLARMVMADHDVEVVFHAAAYKHVPLVESNPIAGLANNVLGTRTLADAANEAGVARFILISTDKAVRPTNIMGASKRLAELVIQDIAKRSRGTLFSMVRFGNVLGSSGSVIPLFKDQIARGGPLTLTHEDVTRYFMTIAEAARLVMLAGSFAGEDECGGEVFVLDMDKPVKIRDLAQQMIEAAGYTVRDADNPNGDIEILVTGLRPGEKLHEELLIGEGLLTTPHPKILRAREACLSELEMAGALRSLRSAVAVGDADAARAVVRAYVEGYRPPGGAEDDTPLLPAARPM
ncbi:polysaccharide biosynthesis protein [Falsirhodobacter xinxiangensis]|uniref:polysaccharide biosynthesis protein n=1 Tax=Falsirhodobacter xinxiangensis TaxID=2530049 RepID=UPI0010AA0802|nr:nucleoside-diphosphate sugar epimerase/dehydratase [Rhodobacter xinxiangensis]